MLSIANAYCLNDTFQVPGKHQHYLQFLQSFDSLAYCTSWLCQRSSVGSLQTSLCRSGRSLSSENDYTVQVLAIDGSAAQYCWPFVFDLAGSNQFGVICSATNQKSLCLRISGRRLRSFCFFFVGLRDLWLFNLRCWRAPFGS